MARHTTPTLLAALVVCGAGASLAHAAAPLTAAPGARVVTVSPVGTTASEPAIAVNPHEPHEVVAVGGRWAAYSIDAGATFTPVRLTAVDHRGRLFLSYLAIQKNGLPGYWGHGTGGNGIWVLRSPDGGKTWDPAPVGVKVWKGDEPDVKLED